MGNMTNTFFDNLDAAATWSAGVAFKRSKGLPLDKYSVFETKALAIEYAEKRGAYAQTPVSYPGQVIAVAEGDKMVAYVLAENAEGTNLELQQIGIIPTGDGKTIAVTDDGVISLLAADTEVFKKDAEGNDTEEKEINAGAQLVLQSDGTLKWVKPDTTTVEGLSTAVEDLKGRMTTAEGDIDKLEAAVGAASVPESTEGAGDGKAATGVYVAIEAEAARAKEAEKALDDAIKAIDFMDADEVADAIEEGIKDLATKKYVDDELAKKVDTETYNTDKKALEDEDAAIREIAEEAKSLIDDFLTGTDTDDIVNKLKEIQAELDKLGDVVDLEAALALKADLEYVNTELAKKQNTIPENTYDAYGSAAAAQEAAEGYTDTKLADYYTKAEIAGLDHATKTDVSEAVAAEAEIARAAEKANADAIKAIADNYVESNGWTTVREEDGATTLKADNNKIISTIANDVAYVTQIGNTNQEL